MNKRFWTPGAYHGTRKTNVFFEGWYYKLISADKSRRLAVIPGIFHHKDSRKSHAFIQVLDGISSEVKYHRFPIDAFRASSRAFVFQVGDSAFHHQGFQINIASEDQTIQGELEFKGIQPWPINFLSPGVMGPYRFAPFMQTYHGVLSLDHAIRGVLEIDGQEFDFNGGRGYIEKDWGKTFPRAYIWMQSNHFLEEDVSLTASVATIPWLRSWFRGFLIGLLTGNKLYRFTTYLGSEIKHLNVNDHQAEWVTYGKRNSDPDGTFPGYRLAIRAERGTSGLLKSPELDGMTPRIFESLTAKLEITLMGLDGEGRDKEIIYQGEGECGGLEIAGSINEILNKSQEQI
jgi:tocopherol cyclase